MKLPKFIKNIFKGDQDNTSINGFIDQQVALAGGNVTTVITKEMLEELLKTYPLNERPIIINSIAKLSFVNGEGKGVKLDVPLLSIVPIPNIPIDSVDLDKYYKDNFGKENSKKDIQNIETVKINVPTLNICKIPSFPKDMKIPEVK